MTPVISPWIIYFIDLADGLSFLVNIIGIFSVGIVFLLGMAILLDGDKVLPKSAKKCFCVSTILLILSLCLTVVIPSSKTCYKMLIANTITYENIDSAKGLTKEAVDYIFDKIENLDINNDSE